ncbi:hypothetical protein [Actinomadura bangladeshensis]|uniref:Uncharacterized protein n=1 Tax=Actinomadura bangladeshensis TaxID=453573 RepID=A0A6L9QA58_9ACTN|nr:hypothetical protein [Actinomadura bangladeshensis]NEA21948.1 hypothetical protein [Actinomadura bangladeshensis]
MNLRGYIPSRLHQAEKYDWANVPDFVLTTANGDQIVMEVKTKDGRSQLLFDKELIGRTTTVWLDRGSRIGEVWLDQEHLKGRRVRRATRVLSCASRVIPKPLRADWLEEQRAYVLDLPTRWSRIRWVASACVGLPRLLIAMRAEARKESA